MRARAKMISIVGVVLGVMLSVGTAYAADCIRCIRKSDGSIECKQITCPSFSPLVERVVGTPPAAHPTFSIEMSVGDEEPRRAHLYLEEDDTVAPDGVWLPTMGARDCTEALEDAPADPSPDATALQVSIGVNGVDAVGSWTATGTDAEIEDIVDRFVGLTEEWTTSAAPAAGERAG